MTAKLLLRNILNDILCQGRRKTTLFMWIYGVTLYENKDKQTRLGKETAMSKTNLSCYYSGRERNTNNLVRQNIAQHIYRK